MVHAIGFHVFKFEKLLVRITYYNPTLEEVDFQFKGKNNLRNFQSE